MSEDAFADHFHIRSYEVDSTGKATLPQIANYFQEAAGKNAHELNFDISHLQEKGLTWVLYRLHIVVDEFPGRWEEVAVQTWPSSGDGIRAFRDYKLLNSEGEKIAVGVSQWMALDTKKRRPVRMPKEILDLGLDVDEHLLSVEKTPFPKLEKTEHTTEITVGAGDLDMNNHTNNVSYIHWMTGYIPGKSDSAWKCRSINLQYHAECGFGDRIIVKTEKREGNRYLHNIIHSETGKLLAEGISDWTEDAGN